MGRITKAVFLFGLAAAPVFGDALLLQGTFAADNTVAFFNIIANSSESITFETYSYGGGTVNSTSIPSGGFAPTGFLFDNLGNVLTLSNGTCVQVATDSITGNCDDLFFQDTLGPGAYTLALAVYDNHPVDGAAADGFVQDDNPGFTCEEAAVSGNFCDVTTVPGTSRTGDYALAITGADEVDQSGTPEPGSIALVLAGIALFPFLRRRLKFGSIYEGQ